jgi:hypothetical protein
MSSNNKILIRKASGESEFFIVSKLKHSLRRAGADSSQEHAVSAASHKPNLWQEPSSPSRPYTQTERRNKCEGYDKINKDQSVTLYIKNLTKVLNLRALHFINITTV